MKKKILGMLGALCMALVMMPMTVKAELAQSVKIAGVTLDENTPYYHNGTDGAVGTADADSTNANATFDAATGTLTLNELNVNTNVVGIAWEGNLAVLERDLTIILANDTTNTIKNTSASAISGGSGAGGSGPSVTIEGSGTLNVTGQSNGFWVWENVTIQDNAKVNVVGNSNVGICNNAVTGVITIKDNAIVNVQGATYGIGFDHYNTNSMQIQGGTLTVTGGTAAFQAAPTLDNSKSWAVTVGADAGSATTWDNTTGLETYKYASITCMGEKSALTGTASISGTPVYQGLLTATLADSNNTGTLTYTWKTGDTVLQEGTSNTYAINNASDIGKTITVTVTSFSHSGSVVSQPTAAVEKAAAASEPSNLQGVKPSTAGGADGKITGVDTTMEYSTTIDFAGKTTCTGIEISGLTAGTYYVRYAENETTKASDYVTVVVPEGDEESGGENTQSGTVENNTNQETNECKATLDESGTDLGSKILTAEEQQKITDGKDVKIWLEVTAGENKITDAEKTLTQSKLGDYTLGKYLDLTLWKQFDGETASKVTATGGTVTVKFAIPQDLINTDTNKTREYQIIRIHDDGTGAKADVLSCSFDAASGIVAFETDKFSIYSLIYKDTAKTTGNGSDNNGGSTDNNNSADDNDSTDNSSDGDDNNDGGSTGNSTPAVNETQWDEVPKTGETSSVAIWLFLALISGVGAVCFRQKAE